MSQYEGKRLKRANSNLIYLVLDGQLRHIPSWNAYTELFENNNWQEWSDEQLATIPLGPPFGGNLALVAEGPKQNSGEKVYLRDGNIIRWIRNPDAMRRYDFSFGRVHWNQGTLPQAHGPDITEQ